MNAAWLNSRKPPLEHFSSEILAIMIRMGDKPAGFRMRTSVLEISRQPQGFILNKNQAAKIDIEGLPDGYSGLLFVVGPSFEAGIYQPMNELIDPSSTAHGKGHETIWAFVWPNDRQYECCGWFSFDCLPDRVIPDNADVAPAHQRRGIASSVYRFIRRVTELDLIPSSVQSAAAVALWKSLAPHVGRL